MRNMIPQREDAPGLAQATWEPSRPTADRVPGGLRDYDRLTHALVAIEVWDAGTRLPRTLLEALPKPAAPHKAAA
jgi:hypothetical protein